MLKLRFLILFIFFNQVIPNFLDYLEKQVDGLLENKCTEEDGKSLIIDNTGQCIERNSFLPKDDIGSKCCSFNGKIDSLIPFKKLYGENWKKIIVKEYGYDPNISEEEIRKKFSENTNEKTNCKYIAKNSNITMLYTFSVSTIDGIVEYDCGEGQKIFNRSQYHPANKEEILDQQLIDSFFLSFTEKDCLKRGAKLAEDDYQICWCETLNFSSGGNNVNVCLPYRASTFQERLKKQLDDTKKDNGKEDTKCTCSNNKNKIIIGRYNTVTGEIKFE